jgi:uncharacterized membrane protein YfcA
MHAELTSPWLLPLLLFCAALLYAAVGHAGASGYLAAMALVGVAPPVMKPTALVLNLVVASLGTWRFWRAGHLRPRALLPYLLGSVPFAALGGAWRPDGALYRPAVGLLLLFAAGALLLGARRPPQGASTESTPAAPTPAQPSAAEPTPHPPRAAVAAGCGAGIGLLAGLTGTGGGIFLSPLLLLRGWARARETAGLSAAFILANSVAGLAGNLASTRALPPELPGYVLAVLAGGLLGSQLGLRHLSPLALRRTVALVLLIAAGKLLLS